MRSYKDLNMNYKGGPLSIGHDMVYNLDGCPQHITGHFDCDYDNLTSLVGGPQKVDGNYDCRYNLLTDLVGCASHIGGELNFYSNNITSLVGIHKIIKSCESIEFKGTQIEVGGIGLLLIKNLTCLKWNMYEIEPITIIGSYLGQGTKGMMECSKELTAKGYEEYAKL